MTIAMHSLLERVAVLSPEKRRLLERRNPLSFAQERVWFLDQLEPGSPFYNVPAAVRLRGALRADLFARALAEVVRRHQVLRTAFPAFDGRALQLVAPAAAVPLAVVDLSALPHAARQPEARRWVVREARRPFDLARGPLLRCALLRLEPADHLFALTLHHIVCDGWSIEILIREVAALYVAFQAGRPSPLPELPIQYADFARWQRERLCGEPLADELAHWRRELAGLPPTLELPCDRPRPAVRQSRGVCRLWALRDGTAPRLLARGREQGATPFMVLLAGFAALLHRLSGQPEVVVGTPVVNRGRLEVEPLVGLFLNTLVLRIRMGDDPSFRDLVARVREVVLAAQAHQELPFERLVDELQPERDLSGNPLFQVMFTLKSAPWKRLTPTGLTIERLEIDPGTSKFDLTLSLVEGSGAVRGALEYSSDLFEATTVERLLGGFETLLAAAARDPELRVGELPLLAAAERHQLLVEWTDAGGGGAWEVPVHALVAAQAERRGDAPALVFAGEALSYRELDRRAARLAAALRAQGVGPEEPVAIFAERSPEMVVALLGVLRAGAAYLPLDPSHPRERLAWMLADAGARVILTQRRLVDALPEHQARVVFLDGEGEAEAGSFAAAELGAVPTHPDSLAYVIYTSGSTGRPKGVEITHRSLAAFLAVIAQCPGLTEGDVLFAVTTLSFDIAALELLLPLTVGARVVVAEPEVPADGRRLALELERSGATVMQATPASWRMLLDAGWRGDGRLAVLCGGEALSRELAEELLAAGGAVWNLYGPTEATVWVTLARVSPGEGPVPIGRPIPGARLHVLDGGMRPAGIGVTGEIYIGGGALARGYHSRPDLTAERFVPDPFGGPGARLYRTGDLGCWLADGQLLCLGRVDQQVKLRGFRIELPEIEAALREHPAVVQAVVVLREDVPGDRRLIAYVVTRGEVPPPAVELLAFLAGKLPAYMLPAGFVALESLPLTPNGKVDRKALPAPAAAPRESGTAVPRTVVEELIAGIWSEVLRRDGVGVHDSFFELGGHSLLATQVIARLRATLGVELPLRRLFTAPTVALLAAAVEAALAERTGAPPPALVRAPRDGELPLSFAQERLWSLHRLDPGDTNYNLLKAVRIEGPLRPPVFARALAEVVRRHEVLRTSFATEKGRPRQVIAPAGAVELPIADLAALGSAAEAAVERLARAEAARPFDLAAGPPLRARLLRLGPGEHVLLLTLHHIAADLWSMGVLLRELTALYEAFAAGRPSPLPELPVQYADYALWQRGWLAGERMARKLAYWREALAGDPPPLRLPADGRRGAGAARGARHPFLLPAPLAAALGALARREGATLYAALLAGYQALLHAATGQTDFVVGSPSAGRRWVETEGLIGFFLETLPLRADLAGNLEFRELVARVGRRVLEAHAHQDVPLQLLAEALGRSGGRRAPLFQAWFAFQNVPLPKPGMAELRYSPIEVETGSAPFDLALLMHDTPAGLAGSLEYRSDLLAAATVARLAEGLRAVLETAAARPQARLDELAALLGESERRRRADEELHYAAALGQRLKNVQRRAVSSAL